jgi:hypothetical protein
LKLRFRECSIKKLRKERKVEKKGSKDIEEIRKAQIGYNSYILHHQPTAYCHVLRTSTEYMLQFPRYRLIMYVYVVCFDHIFT